MKSNIYHFGLKCGKCGNSTVSGGTRVIAIPLNENQVKSLARVGDITLPFEPIRINKHTLSPPGCAAVKCRQTPLELVFVIDSSESVGPEHFDVVKDFVNALVDRASVSPNATRVGVVLYSHHNQVVVSLGEEASDDRVKSAVRSMTYMGEGTYTGSAIHQANRLFLAARRGVRKVAIVITDGQADERDKVSLVKAVTEAHVMGIEMFVIGVVNQSDTLYKQFRKELNLMASDPDDEHVFLIKDFDTLSSEWDYVYYGVMGIRVGLCVREWRYGC